MTRSQHVLLALVAGWLVAGAVAADPAPANLRLVGDHWTAWDPPQEYPEGTEIYKIQRLDTLWDLAAQFLGDPYLWPQLWEQNSYIQDAHWIYPGDPLAVGLSIYPVETLADAPLIEATENGTDLGEDPGLQFGSEQGSLQAAGYPTDLYCTGFVADPDLDFAYQVAGSEEAALAPTLRSQDRPAKRNQQTLKVDLTVGDIVYIDGGAATGLAAGSEFFIVGRDELVKHPVRKSVIGRYYQYQGRLRVLSVQAESAIAEVTHACRAVYVGAWLMPFETLPIPLITASRPPSVNAPVPDESLDNAATVVFSENRVFSLGQGSIVYVDLGSGQASPGDRYRIWRRNHEGLPPVILGELAILRVGEVASMARILNSRYTIRVGDRIAL